MEEKPNEENTIGLDFREWVQMNYNFLKEKYIRKFKDSFTIFCKEEYDKEGLEEGQWETTGLLQYYFYY